MERDYTLVVSSERMVEFANTVAASHWNGVVVNASVLMRQANAYELLWASVCDAEHVIICTADDGGSNAAQRNQRISSVDDIAHNRLLPAWIAVMTRAAGIGVTLLSSMWVFGPSQVGARCGTIPKPESWFGCSMNIAERVVRQVNPKTTILRLPWMYGPEFPDSAPVQNHLAGPVRVPGAGIAYRRASLESTQQGLIAYTREVVQSIKNHRLVTCLGDSHNIYPHNEYELQTWFEFVTSSGVDTSNAYEYHANGQKRNGFVPCEDRFVVEFSDSLKDYTLQTVADSADLEFEGIKNVSMINGRKA